MDKMILKEDLEEYINEINNMSIEDYNLLMKRSIMDIDNVQKTLKAKEIKEKIAALESKSENLRDITVLSALISYSASVGLTALLGYIIPTDNVAKIVTACLSGHLAGLTIGTGCLFMYMDRTITRQMEKLRIHVLKNKLEKLEPKEQKKYINFIQDTVTFDDVLDVGLEIQ